MNLSFFMLSTDVKNLFKKSALFLSIYIEFTLIRPENIHYSLVLDHVHTLCPHYSGDIHNTN